MSWKDPPRAIWVKPERTRDDVLRDFEALAIDASRKGHRVEAIELDAEDWALFESAYDVRIEPYTVALLFHEAPAIVRRRK